MKMNRRGFLATGAALALAPSLALPEAGNKILRIAPARQHLVGASYPATEVWAYNGQVPGPQLRLRQGERLRIEVENALGVGTTVHWHGIRVPNAMDGVPNVTQPRIAANGGRFTYGFELPDAGTFWYHPHLGSAEQVARGLYGALIVEERDAPAVDRDLVWVLSDWRLDGEARIRADFGNPMDASHAGRIGNTVTVNGVLRDGFAVRAGERIRLRLINASTARVYSLSFEGHEPWVIALDAQPVAPHWFGRVVLGPGMRADLILDCVAPPGSRHRVIDGFYRQRAYELLKLEYSDEKPLRESFEPAPRLRANPLAQPDEARAERHRIVFGGGMMGAMPSQREHRGLFWTVNGKPVPEHDHAPLLTLGRGKSYVIEFVNETSWHHPIHLHGHVFRLVSRNGKEVLPRQFADTLLMDPDSRAQIAFVADNPGDWMLHCHVLEHQASGMMALVRVA
ncbi:MAG TPA: multicopper oxidase family protein [Burkholderiales bacterium]|jgi:FtsP/CotA-like multicopper oxidase with cupredoxin domain|nr:multicopper oxidase family protein [Burkholderiales bacterium]